MRLSGGEGGQVRGAGEGQRGSKVEGWFLGLGIDTVETRCEC